MWWTILAFCVLSYVGSAMTTIFVCDDQNAKYNYGMCAKPNEQKRAQFSLWFAYAVDVAGDLAVMFLPFRMTWNLRLPRAQKLGIFVLFGSGWICIVFATLRVVQVSVKDGLPKIPDPKWLQMWTVIETSMGWYYLWDGLSSSADFKPQRSSLDVLQHSTLFAVVLSTTTLRYHQFVSIWKPHVAVRQRGRSLTSRSCERISKGVKKHCINAVRLDWHTNLESAP
ncbi:hypothetical protein J4E86_006061 [Alternaria arbusti]|uniref:uncharacterized protein n=1 Tax=Alternaria arbusti TaxID=232088 RepID=UPI002220BAA5|nr:uncharacterized protein J4E86_006061 [Alternaria arbusti]KAI4954751.1 hypothetical protein J4E86_006061 [Alternaria arbusti]